MSFFVSYIHFGSCLIYTALAFYTLSRNPSSFLNRSVFLMIIFFATWSFGYVFIHNPYIPKNVAEFMVHLPTFAVGGYGVMIFLSMGAFTGILRKNIMLFVILAVFVLMVVIFQLTGNLAIITDNNNKYLFWNVQYQNDIILVLVNTIYNLLVISGFVMMLFFHRRTMEPDKKQQSKIILITGFISFLFASINVYLSYLIPEKYFPELVDVWVLIFACGLVYSIVKLELFEITPSAVANEIINMMPAGLILTDNKLNVTRVNKALLHISGRKTRYFIQNHLNTIYFELTGNPDHIDDKQNFTKQVNIQTGKNKKAVFWNTRKIMMEQNIYAGTVTVISDIDQLVKAQKELKELNMSLENQIRERTGELLAAKETAEENNRLKTAFLNNISHEFRTPMNGIIGFSRLITEKGLSEEKRKFYGGNIIDSCEKLLDIVTDTVEISQIQSKDTRLQITKISPRQVISRVTDKMKPKADHKNLEYITMLNGLSHHLLMETDENKLYRILTHLMDNAIKFTSTGTVQLSVKSMPPNNMEFSIKDTGIGISATYQKEIFEPFRQAELDHSTYGGNGVGLALVKSYTEMLKGNINLISEINKGTEIKVCLPIKYT